LDFNVPVGVRKVLGELIAQEVRKDSATGDSLRLSLYSETVSVLLDGDEDVNSGAVFIGRVITAGGQPCVYL
jgi:hypothetical protein